MSIDYGAMIELAKTMVQITNSAGQTFVHTGESVLDIERLSVGGMILARALLALEAEKAKQTANA